MSRAQKDDLGAPMLHLNSWTPSAPCPVQLRHPQDTGNLLHSFGFSFTTAERGGPGHCALKLNKQKLCIDPVYPTQHRVFIQSLPSFLTIQKTSKPLSFPSGESRLEVKMWDFYGDLVAKTLSSQSWGLGFNPWSGN